MGNRNKKTKSPSQCEKERRELVNFRAFRRDYPAFGARVVSCRRGADPPDFICRDSRKARIGIELLEWLEQGQTKLSKKQYAQEDPYRRAVADWHILEPTNVRMILIYPKDGIFLDPSDEGQFRDEIYQFITEKDRAWAHNPEWHDPQGYDFTEFVGFPVLAKQLAGVTFFPALPSTRRPGFKGIHFEGRGGAYGPEPMVEALLENVRKKIIKYARPATRQKIGSQHLDTFCLLAYYDQAVLHNTPYRIPGFGLREIGARLTEELSRHDHPFNEVFLYSPIEKVDKAIQVWPAPRL
jgi:hypothetical protein